MAGGDEGVEIGRPASSQAVGADGVSVGREESCIESLRTGRGDRKRRLARMIRP
jgi:hypothetical protein